MTVYGMLCERDACAAGDAAGRDRLADAAAELAAADRGATW